MGPNNRRAQERAAASQNTPSRARFSKGPPKKNAGRGGRGGRHRRGDAADRTKASVVNKITQRVQQKRVLGSSGTAVRKRHPLDGIDIAKLDEVTLSDESIQLVTKLLRDLKVMESDDSPNSYDAEEKDEDEILDDDDDESGQPERPTSGAGGYTEYKEDVDDFDEGYMQGATVEDDVDAEDNAPTKPSVDDQLQKSPLFQHLTFKLSFTEGHATRACRGIETWGAATESSEEASLSSEK